MDKLMETIENEIRGHFSGMLYKEIELERPVKIVGYASQIGLKVETPDDPFYPEWRKLLSTIVPKYMCGPYISGANIVTDRRTDCPMEPISTNLCRYGCAPIFVLYYNQTPIRTYPPCHAIESPTCCDLASYCPSETCTMLRGYGCKNEFDYYYITYSILDLTTDEYTFDGMGLNADTEKLLDTRTGTYTKKRDDILYAYIRIIFS